MNSKGVGYSCRVSASRSGKFRLRLIDRATNLSVGSLPWCSSHKEAMLEESRLAVELATLIEDYERKVKLMNSTLQVTL